MDTRKYEVFVRAAEYKSLTKAGEAMGYTQSGVSHMMKSLEDELGFPVFLRSAKGITLNENGKKLLPVVRKLLAWSEQLEQTISSINGLATGRISIGTFSSVSVHWLPRIIKEFQRDYPQVEINLREGGIQEIDAWLTEGAADIGIYSRQPHQSFDWIILKEDPMLAILPKDYPAPTGGFPIGEFNGKPFILSAGGFDYDVHRILRQGGIDADVRFSSMDDYAIISMVQNGLGFSILPELVLNWAPGHITALPLAPAAFRTLGIAFPSIKRASPAVKIFVKYAKKILIRDKLIPPHPETVLCESARTSYSPKDVYKQNNLT